MNVLAIGANPDDVELLCAGTLIRYREEKHKITVCWITKGDKGSLDASSQEVVEIRTREACKAASLIGAEVIPSGIPDGEIYHNEKMRRKLVDIIREARPDVIITHSPNDYMSDHTLTSQLVFEASFWVGSPGYKGEKDLPICQVRPFIFYMDTVAGVNFLPIEYVDITPVFEKKREMLACHQSQIKFLKERDGIDLLDMMTIMARFRGFQCGVTYAEGFQKFEAYLRNTPKRLLP
jgi:LmbE family N-acetylglucosaminyl deacetylase